MEGCEIWKRINPAGRADISGTGKKACYLPEKGRFSRWVLGMDSEGKNEKLVLFWYSFWFSQKKHFQRFAVSA